MMTMVRSVRRWCSVFHDSGHATLALQATPPHLIDSAVRTTPPGNHTAIARREGPWRVTAAPDRRSAQVAGSACLHHATRTACRHAPLR